MSPQDFQPADDLSHGLGPAGKRRYRNGQQHHLQGVAAGTFTGATRDGIGCARRSQCLRTPHTSAVRQVAIVLGRTPGSPERAIERRKRTVDSGRGPEMIGRRCATVEPVFGNRRDNNGLDRFTRRGRQKGDGPWMWYGLVHHLEQLGHQG